MKYRDFHSATQMCKLAIFIAFISRTSSAFTVTPGTLQPTTTKTSTGGLTMVVEEDVLDGLTNHEEEGSMLAKSITGWLDREWMPQEVHARMGESAKRSFVAARESGVNTIAPIMMSVADDLETNWAEYDDDAFVNAWDIGNYVSDYLMDRLGNEGCGCSAEIYKDDASSTSD